MSYLDELDVSSKVSVIPVKVITKNTIGSKFPIDYQIYKNGDILEFGGSKRKRHIHLQSYCTNSEVISNKVLDLIAFKHGRATATRHRRTNTLFYQYVRYSFYVARSYRVLYSNKVSKAKTGTGIDILSGKSKLENEFDTYSPPFTYDRI